MNSITQRGSPPHQDSRSPDTGCVMVSMQERVTSHGALGHHSHHGELSFRRSFSLFWLITTNWKRGSPTSTGLKTRIKESGHVPSAGLEMRKPRLLKKLFRGTLLIRLVALPVRAQQKQVHQPKNEGEDDKGIMEMGRTASPASTTPIAPEAKASVTTFRCTGHAKRRPAQGCTLTRVAPLQTSYTTTATALQGLHETPLQFLSRPWLRRRHLYRLGRGKATARF